MVNLTKEQSAALLEDALKTLRIFATPSLSPEKFENFEEIEKELKKIYCP